MGSWLSRPKALLLDLDNTLYDWVAYFAPALRGMCRALSEESGITSETLFNEFRAVFKLHGTVEYSFALQELPSLMALHPDESSTDLVSRYRQVIEVFQHRRRVFLRPYPGVRSGLLALRDAGFSIFGVTDSRRFQAENRLRQLRLDRLLDGLFSAPDHSVPDAETVAVIRQKPSEYYTSNIRSVSVLPTGVRKPAPEVLAFVSKVLELDLEACIYVGDSLAKDVAMAQRAGVYDCWAEYGARVSPLDFSTVVRVTDWPRSAVTEALNPSPERLRVFPSFVAPSFEAVVDLALKDPVDRPPRQRPRREPTQLALFEVGPQMAQRTAQ